MGALKTKMVQRKEGLPKRRALSELQFTPDMFARDLTKQP